MATAVEQPKQAMYGALPPPPPEAPVRLHDYPPFDVRHGQDAPPMPSLRYFFPRDFDRREGDEQCHHYYQFFDVQLGPVQEDAGVLPPPWTPNAFFRLSFTQTKFDPDKKVDVPGRVPDLTSPLTAKDVTQGGTQIFGEGAETYLQEVLAFCRHVSSFKPHIWRDALPLVDLLRGVLLYLVTQAEAGIKLARDYALRDALAAQEADRAAVRAAAAADLARMREAWDADAAANAAAQKEALRKQLAEELTAQIRSLNEERERWAQKAAAGDAAIKKLTDSEAALERRVAQLEAQLDSDRAEHARLLAARTQEAAQAQQDAQASQDALLKARGAILSALRAETKSEVVSAALAAIHTTLPGAAAYVADVRQRPADLQPLGGDLSAALADVRKAAQAEGPDSPLAALLAGLSPEFLGCPMSAGVLSAAGSVQAMDAVSDHMQLQYLAATPGQEFVVGQSLAWPQGASWSAVQSGQLLHVLDVTQHGGIAFLRAGAQPVGGSFLAVPIHGQDGEVVGLLGLDTLQTSAMTADGGGLQLGEEDAEFVQQLAGIIGDAVARDQRALAGLLDQVAAASSAAGDTPAIAADPEKYADGKGGKQLLKVAISALQGLSEEELEAFRGIDAPSDTTLGLLRTIMRAAGQVDDASWSSLRGHLTRDLLARLAALDPEAAWAEWQQLVGSLQPLLEAELQAEQPLEDLVLLDTDNGEVVAAAVQDASLSSNVGLALTRWVVAVRKISAARELQRAAEARLERANAALLRALSDGKAGGEASSANALQELRSYRVPPKHTFVVLQAVLHLAGASEEDRQHWGRMKVLTTYKLIKQLTELRPASVAPKVLSGLRRSMRDVDDADVRKESAATLALFHWLQQFLRCAEAVAS